MEPQQIQPRQIAYIVSIKDILSAKFVKEDSWNPNHVVIDNKQVSRVNIIGTIIGVQNQENLQNMLIDDGSDKISVRNFEKTHDLKVGDVVLLIGRVREYGNERYITSEIIRKDINPTWNKVWKQKSLKYTESEIKEAEELKNTKNELIEGKNDNNKDINEEEIVEDTQNISQRTKILMKIKELDDGSGAAIEEVLKFFSDEKTIADLIMQGEIFEIKPGKIKVLE